jgi:hypothetical protein
MARRIGALMAMAIVLALSLLLVWSVYLHRQQSRAAEEPAIVTLNVRPA